MTTNLLVFRTAAECEFDVLGELQVRVGDTAIPLTRGRNSAVLLATLLVKANRTVTIEHIIDTLWEGEPPKRARESVHVYVGRIREALAAHHLPRTMIRTVNGGYCLDVAPERVDWLRFLDQVKCGHDRFRLGMYEPAAAAFDAALALWRCDPLVGIATSAELSAFATSMMELRLGAQEARMECLIECGAGREVVGELFDLVAAHPFRENLYRFLMIALYRSGRRNDALGIYARLRSVLREDLGIEPDPVIHSLFCSILNHSTLEPHRNANVS